MTFGLSTCSMLGQGSTLADCIISEGNTTNYYFQKHEGLEKFGTLVRQPTEYNEGLSKIIEPALSAGRYAPLLS